MPIPLAIPSGPTNLVKYRLLSQFLFTRDEILRQFLSKVQVSFARKQRHLQLIKVFDVVVFGGQIGGFAVKCNGSNFEM
ncbi:hypothetical protein MKW98_026512 [Papaver atlanticum]|uniref:Uncharacterized protein n=1 Tax=Papaver atlanticum TaxID=357466 RepID=A0AAD4XS40_9MAGN|nr:hypothetical protein MKW98_026512 [Papaver atlanticum]